jgi:hypothetical protein
LSCHVNHINFDANITQNHINLKSTWVPKEKKNRNVIFIPMAIKIQISHNDCLDLGFGPYGDQNLITKKYKSKSSGRANHHKFIGFMGSFQIYAKFIIS